MKNIYKIWDKQLQTYKDEDYFLFKSESEAYTEYGASLYDQCLDGNGGFEDMEEEEIKNKLSKLSNKDLFELFDYEVHELDYNDILGGSYQ